MKAILGASLSRLPLGRQAYRSIPGHLGAGVAGCPHAHHCPSVSHARWVHA